ncbi:MAG: hypothetical protein IJ809_03290 [Clostridia bacterium]|nr:hypothetical protein [Clostridia bacterium]
MQKLSVSDEEQMSRKEYLKNKRKQERQMNSAFGRLTKKKVIVAMLIIVLLAYVAIQFYIYYKQTNYTYLSAEEVDSQKVYDIYYMSEGYTYNPSSSLNYIKSNSFDLTRIYTDLGFEQIKVLGDKLLGIKDKKLYYLHLDDNQTLTEVYEKEIDKYTVYGNDVYVITSEDKKITKISLMSLSDRIEFDKEGVVEILVDDNYIFLCIEDKNKKGLYRYSQVLTDEMQLTDSENVSYIVEDNDNIYFVNKADENRVYKVNKNGGVEKISDDVKSVTDKGAITQIDGSKYMFCYSGNLYYINIDDNRCLWKVNLESLEREKVLYSSIEILQNVEDTVFYKIEDQRGLFLYNVDTGFNSEVSSRLITEFVVKK